MSMPRPPNEPSLATWDCMLPGPPSKNNCGSADLSSAGLLAYAAGSSVAILDTHSMQLVSTIPLPPQASSTVSPFITAVRWSPLPLPHYLLESENTSSHLLLAVGDRHGRISLLDFRSKAPVLSFDTNNPNSSKLGIQDLCWIQARPDSWCLAAISGPSFLSIYNTATGRCFFKYDSSPEYFSCLGRDPFDSRHFCALGLKGFLLSVRLLGDDSENDVALKELQIRTDASELQRLERFFSGKQWGAGFCDLPQLCGEVCLLATLETSGLPRGCSKILEVLPDVNMEVFYCAHLDGKLSTWRRKEPKWPSSSFVTSDGLITAMAYRLPHVVIGDRTGNIRWWDVTTGQSSSFNTHRDGIRRIKFSPVVPGDRSRGRIAVLFYDNTFSVFDLDSPDPLANSLLQPQFPGTLVVELDWLPLRTSKDDPLVLCIAGADSSFRLVELNVNDQKMGVLGPQVRPTKERFRPVPLPSPVLLPTPHALALRMILQLGVKPAWFDVFSATMNDWNTPGTPSAGDLRGYMIASPRVGDSVVPEMLLKVLEPYRKAGCLLDDERVRLYAKVVKKGSTLRLAFAAGIFGESMEALFWLQLPHALNHLMNKLVNKSTQRGPHTARTPEIDEASMLSRISSKGKSAPGSGKKNLLVNGQLKLMAFEQQELWERANERINWHEKLEGEEAIQNRIHELVSVGNLEAAVSLLLSTSPESSYFYVNALRAVVLSSAVSSSLHELAVKVVAANMVRNDRSMSGTHLLCAVGRYQEACSQLQDAGCWTDAATLAATHLKGSDYARVLHRWAEHVLHTEHNIWRALILYVAAGGLQEALAALRQAQLPDTAAMFILVCREIHAEFLSHLDSDEDATLLKNKVMNLPGLNPENEDVVAVGEYYGQYQRKLVHMCMDSQPYTD
ncbi:UNVERIFIED_CONTAM: hypothetical protein Sangu_1553400 [Sesamum angustifolium]|uniref:WD repeat-containing protein 11 n=1 Tax=Sesamum angustifolium TaxID=2727405 RepID=A0AAW2MU38_9LAMI